MSDDSSGPLKVRSSARLGPRELAEQLACVRQALPEEWRDSVPSVAVATLVAELELLRKDRPKVGVAVVFKHETRAWFLDADLAEEWTEVHCPGATLVEA